MTMIKSCVPLILTVLAASNPLAAHHAFSTEFDPDLMGEVEGPVTEVLWANPHIRYGVQDAFQRQQRLKSVVRCQKIGSVT